MEHGRIPTAISLSSSNHRLRDLLLLSQLLPYPNHPQPQGPPLSRHTHHRTHEMQCKRLPLAELDEDGNKPTLRAFLQRSVSDRFLIHGSHLSTVRLSEKFNVWIRRRPQSSE